jgi:hypothetical protein
MLTLAGNILHESAALPGQPGFGTPGRLLPQGDAAANRATATDPSFDEPAYDGAVRIRVRIRRIAPLGVEHGQCGCARAR